MTDHNEANDALTAMGKAANELSPDARKILENSMRKALQENKQELMTAAIWRIVNDNGGTMTINIGDLDVTAMGGVSLGYDFGTKQLILTAVGPEEAKAIQEKIASNSDAH